MGGRTICAAYALAFVFVLALDSSAAWSAVAHKREAILELDPGHTQISFTLKGFPHTTTGSFKLKRGQIRIDPETGRADGSITVDAASGTTGIGMRDGEMRNSILETQRYPEISFVPRRALGHPVLHGDFIVSVNGVLFLHGDRHDLTVEVAIHRTGDDFTAASRLTIPYVRWGLKNPSLLFLTVSDEVTVDVTTAGRVTWVQAR
jgi:polyisoprenoid-binding protein YceI